ADEHRGAGRGNPSDPLACLPHLRADTDDASETLPLAGNADDPDLVCGSVELLLEAAVDLERLGDHRRDQREEMPAVAAVRLVILGNLDRQRAQRPALGRDRDAVEGAFER